MNATSNVLDAFVDRRGLFHTCDKETYRKLKRVRHYRHWAFIQKNRLERWSRKLPHNRVLWHKEPATGHFAKYGKWVSEVWPKPVQCPVEPLALQLMYDNYLTAKRGVEKKEDVQLFLLPMERVNDIISQCEEWLKLI